MVYRLLEQVIASFYLDHTGSYVHVYKVAAVAPLEQALGSLL